MSDKATAVAAQVEVSQVTPRIGAVIDGVDLAGDLSDEVVGSIRTALLSHRVVFFREQHLDGGGPGQVRKATRTSHPRSPDPAVEQRGPFCLRPRLADGLGSQPLAH